ncbi:polyketide cyclase [Mycobacterium sp. djl-10]|nr:polyketide cyclase [Mycobacterium sp. djl-10]
MTEHSEVESSLTVKRDTEASRDQVWSVIADGWTYSQWVVGNSRMRAVDPNWPQEGSTIRHSVGAWPLLLDDVTLVQECVPKQKLVLLAKGRPLGKARITLRLFDIDGGGCRIEMSEVPVGAPMGWVPQKAALAAAYPRNRECTWRLAAIAERRTPADLSTDESE